MSSTEEVQPVTIPGQWDFRYNYFAGAAASRFFHELKNKRVMGTLCPECERVLVPARGFCDACYVETTEWREVGKTGHVEAFTILTSSFPGLPDPPVAVGYVSLEGASTAVLNFIRGIDLADTEAAAQQLLSRPRVRVDFVDACQGRITDFAFVVDPE